MADTILLALAEWSIRATVLAGAVGLLLWVARITNAHIKLAAWTIVLVVALLMPLAAPPLATPWMPHVSVSVPRFLKQTANRNPQPQPVFNLPAVPHFNGTARRTFSLH